MSNQEVAYLELGRLKAQGDRAKAALLNAQCDAMESLMSIGGDKELMPIAAEIFGLEDYTGEDDAMSEIIEMFPNEDSSLAIERGEEFCKAAKALSEYIVTLPLSVAQNKELINLIIAQVEAADRDSLTHGFQLGLECCDE